MTEYGSVRLRLIGLALLGTLPFIALGVFRLASTASREREMLATDAIDGATIAAARIDERIRTADAVLVGLSTTLIPSASLRQSNEDVLRPTLSLAPPHVGNLYLLDSTGTLVATAMPSSAAYDTARAFANRAYFERAHHTRDLIVGELRRSVVMSGNPWVIILARAIVDANGDFLGVVAMPVRVDSLIAVASRTTKFGSVSDVPLITVFDTAGVVVARSLDGDSVVGKSRLPAGINIDTTGTVSILGIDSVRRFTGFTRTRTAPWMVSVGMAQTTLDAGLNASIRQDVLLFLLAITFAVSTAYYVGQRITQPVAGLVNAAHGFERGDTGTRAAIGGPTEIRLLSNAFNQMAETVERRNAALADSERRYRLLFDSNPLPMWAWDADSMHIMAVNEAAVEKYGYPREQFLKLQVTDLLADQEQERFSKARLPFSESRQNAGTWLHRTAEGRTLEMEVITTSSRRLGRASWLSVGIDITARGEAERALARSEEQLRQSQKMEAIGTFAGGISHDFNNLLTGILGYCDLALTELDPESEVYRDVSEVRALAVRGSDLSRNVLTVSRKQVVQPTRLQPNDVINGLDRLLRRVVGAHIVYTLDLDESISAIRADAGQLEQVLLNLTSNARDAMGAGGTLRIATRNIPGNHPLVEHHQHHDTWVQITVSDTGIGMTSEVMDRIFEPFFTTKDHGKGTGLGLALVYAMVEQAGGVVRVSSIPDRGSSFHVLFPAVDATGPDDAIEPVAVGNLSGTETVLLAEDEDSVRMVATAALERHGYRVLAAPNGAAALAIVRAYAGTIDLLLTDVVMPGMNGRELADQVKRARADIRVVFVSGYTDDATLLGDVRRNEITFLQKPFTALELVQRVRIVLDLPPHTVS
jgi:PAS domain S-box-containing protein